MKHRTDRVVFWSWFVAAFALVLGLCALVTGQSAYVTLLDGRTIRQDGPGSVQDGHYRITIEKCQTTKGVLYEALLENTGRACWRWPELVGGDWIAYREFVLDLPDNLRPIYWPLDGTVPRDGPRGKEWVVEGDMHPRALDRGNLGPLSGKGRDPQPPAGHCLEGREIYPIIFGEPGVEVALKPEGQAALRAFLYGGYGGGGDPKIQAIVNQWESGPPSFNPFQHPWTAGHYWNSAASFFPGYPPARGRAFGFSPGPDGWQMGGQNAQANAILGFLAKGTSTAMQSGLVIARHVAGHGWVHESPEVNGDAWRYGFLTGRRRIEKADDSDFTGSSFNPDLAHFWTADIQLCAAMFPDPLLVRTADEARRRLMSFTSVWAPQSDSRILDRFLEGLICAWRITGDDKYLDRAELLVNNAVAAIPPGDHFFRLTAGGPTQHTISVWMDGSVLARIQELIDLGRCAQHEARVMEHVAWFKDHVVAPDGSAAYQMLQDTTQAVDDWQAVTPRWPVLSAQLLSAFWWAGKKDPAFRPTAARLVRYWAQGFAPEWIVQSSSAIAKTRAQELEAMRRSGLMIAEARAWTP
jgi:hypothetical protein